ncbi:hypothetical protein B484DRAFT_414555, partial [Ochromonadaceae sp. CCMP2298]
MCALLRCCHCIGRASPLHNLVVIETSGTHFTVVSEASGIVAVTALQVAHIIVEASQFASHSDNMGSGASSRVGVTHRSHSPKDLGRKHSPKDLVNIFHGAAECTLNDCFVARASWYRLNAQGPYRHSALSGAWSSAFLSPTFYQTRDEESATPTFYQHLHLTYYPHSTLLQKTATFQSLFLEDLFSILLAGVVSYKAVARFYYLYKSIPIREYGMIGETLIETLMEALKEVPTTVPTTATTATATAT